MKEFEGWRYVDEPVTVCRSMSSYASRDKHRAVKYIEGKCMSQKQTGEVFKAQSALDATKNQLDSLTKQLEQAETQYKSACENYITEIKTRRKTCKDKAKILIAEGKAIEAKLKSENLTDAKEEEDD